MSFLLDTNILSTHLRRPGGLSHRFVQHSGRLNTSSLCVAELLVWAYRKHQKARAVAAVEQLLQQEVVPLSFDMNCARQHGELSIKLLPNGIVIPTVDLMIAATAIVYNLCLVTNNRKDFERIPGLVTQDWL